MYSVFNYILTGGTAGNHPRNWVCRCNPNNCGKNRNLPLRISVHYTAACAYVGPCRGFDVSRHSVILVCYAGPTGCLYREISGLPLAHLDLGLSIVTTSRQTALLLFFIQPRFFFPWGRGGAGLIRGKGCQGRKKKPITSIVNSHVCLFIYLFMYFSGNPISHQRVSRGNRIYC